MCFKLSLEKTARCYLISILVFFVFPSTVSLADQIIENSDSGEEFSMIFEEPQICSHMRQFFHFTLGQMPSSAEYGFGACLFDAFPNPFNPVTTIAFEAVSGMHARLSVYDVAGRLVKVLVDERVVSSGRQEAVWNGRDANGRTISAGVYFYRLEAGSYSETKRLVMVK